MKIDRKRFYLFIGKEQDAMGAFWTIDLWFILWKNIEFDFGTGITYWREKWWNELDTFLKAHPG